MSLFKFLTEDLVSESDARSITEPYWTELTGVWASAWREWQNMSDDHRRRLGETPYAPPVVLNSFAQSFARERFSNRESEGLVVCDEIPNVFTLYVQPHVLLRFNSFGTDFAVHNTDRSILKDAYFRQEPIPGLDNSATRLTVGYLADEAKVNIACVAISLQVGPDPVYYFLIDRAEQRAVPIPGPTVPRTPVTPREQLSRKKPR
jgi:hypothetical protein